MKPKSEKNLVLKQEEIIEQKLSELMIISENQLNTAKRLNEQLENSVNLITEVTRRAERLNDRLEGIEERVEVEASKSSCRLF